jgi:hypothetical protein
MSLRPKPIERAKEFRQVKDNLTNQFYNHVEGTVTTYRKLVHRFLTFKRPKGKKKERENRTVIPEVSTHPATDELPQFW